MKFIITYAIKPGHMAAAVSRFLKTGGMPPKGVKMLNRWHGAGLGFILAETKDNKALYEWLSQGTDQMEFAIHPVVEDRNAAAVLRKIYK